MAAQRQSRGVDRAIAAVAERQHGVVARWQLVEMGLGRGAIAHRLECGRLHPVHRGVYAVGHRVISLRGRWMAATLWAGPHTALSHRAAAALWGVLPSDTVEVTTHPQRRPQDGILVHCVRLPDDETTEHDGLPVTTLPRTLLDLAAVVPRRKIERAITEAEVRRLRDVHSLDDLLARHPRCRGARTIRAILAASRLGAQVTRSELEDRFLAFVDEVGLPGPQVNRSLHVQGRWIEVDCAWPEHRLVVELDGHWVHATRRAYENDRRRDRALQAAGWRVVRVTWRQLHEAPAALAADLRALLA